MSFRFRCPKCDSPDGHLDRSSPIQTGGPVDPIASLIFSCRCGKQFYGAAVQPELARQQAIYDRDQADEAKKAVQTAQEHFDSSLSDIQKRVLKLKTTMLRKTGVELKVAEKQLKALLIQADEAKKAKVQPLRLVPPVPIEEVRPPEQNGRDPLLCAQPECERLRRTTSIYCSADCRVKVAHSRERERKKAKRKAK